MVTAAIHPGNPRQLSAAECEMYAKNRSEFVILGSNHNGPDGCWQDAADGKFYYNNNPSSTQAASHTKRLVLRQSDNIQVKFIGDGLPDISMSLLECRQLQWKMI